MSLPALLELPINTQGHDFVVGDLHGCRHLLEAQLQSLGFNAAVDRVISVGDLIDRGPDSWNTLRLIEEPWFHFVLGNHEEMLLGLLEASNGPWSVDPESAWINNLNPDQINHLRRVLVPILEAAPLAIKVGSGDDTYFVIHADRTQKSASNPYQLVPDHALGDALDEDEHLRSSALWSRRLFKDLPADTHAQSGVLVTEPANEFGVSLTYVGHSVVSAPVLFRSHLFIDTGAYETGVLTVLRV